MSVGPEIMKCKYCNKLIDTKTGYPVESTENYFHVKEDYHRELLDKARKWDIHQEVWGIHIHEHPKQIEEWKRKAEKWDELLWKGCYTSKDGSITSWKTSDVEEWREKAKKYDILTSDILQALKDLNK